MGDKLRVRIWETLEKSVGHWLLPWQVRRVGIAQADVRRHDALMTAQIESEIAAFKRGELIFDSKKKLFLPASEQDAPNTDRDKPPSLTKAIETLHQRIERRLALDHLQREIRMIKAINIAEDEAALMEENSNDPAAQNGDVDSDWISRWRTHAETIDSERVRQLWGRILAGEVNKPGAYSLRTLSILSNISERDARLVESIGPLVLDGKWIASVLANEGGQQKYGVSFDDLLVLDEMGILSVSQSDIGLSMSVRSLSAARFETSIQAHDKGIVLKGSNPATKIDIPAIVLTTAGRQILSLGRFTARDDYLLEVGRTLKRNDIVVRVGKMAKEGTRLLFSELVDV